MKEIFASTPFSSRRLRWLGCLVVSLFATLSLADASEANEPLLKEISKSFSAVAKKATPAVVYIESQTAEKTTRAPTNRGPFESPFDYFGDDFFNRFFNSPFSPPPSKKSQEVIRGSGFLISADGYLVTNNHVVENASKVTVTLHSGKKASATVVGTDPKTDLALLKIEEKNLPYLSFSDSDKLEVGDWTIAIGNPFGLQATVTVGIVSAKGRNQLHLADFEDFIQTDAAINPGNSGGPLLDIEGEVIGVNTAIVSGSGGYIGIGFAIPSNMAKEIINQLRAHGQVTRGFLGVTLQPIDEELANFYKLKSPKGALVTDIVKGSPADVAGIKQEDVIVGYNGHTVENIATFRNHVSLLPPGSKLKLRIQREGVERELSVTVTALPKENVSAHEATKTLGFQVEELSPELAQRYGYTEEQGVLITKVEQGSPAAEAALRPGSLILAVNRKKVASLDQFSQALADASKEGRVLLMVRQGSGIRFVALRVDD